MFYTIYIVYVHELPHNVICLDFLNINQSVLGKYIAVLFKKSSTSELPFLKKKDIRAHVTHLGWM
jgi:hypothetical protein